MWRVWIQKTLILVTWCVYTTDGWMGFTSKLNCRPSKKFYLIVCAQWTTQVRLRVFQSNRCDPQTKSFPCLIKLTCCFWIKDLPPSCQWNSSVVGSTTGMRSKTEVRCLSRAPFRISYSTYTLLINSCIE